MVISWQFDHFWAYNCQGINNSHRILKSWFNASESNNLPYDFHHIPKLEMIGFEMIFRVNFKWTTQNIIEGKEIHQFEQ